MLSRLVGRVDGDVDEASSLIGPVAVEQGAKISRSVIRGPAVIGADTVVEDSLVGPNASISFGCRIENSQIEDSIVMERCRVADVRAMAQSLLGKDVEVRRGRRSSAMYRLMLGDQSQVEVF
jgi:glucose-1-phosphate thymidylyltransferase